jgi:GDPmannose 4,6-dehydratase
MLVMNYRETYGLFAASGILFNHESPLRPPGFVTQKIVQSAARIAAGQQDSLTLGNIAVSRDWGWAPDYVGAMWRMMQADRPEDFVIATGEARPLEDFVALAFSFFNMDWRDHVTHDAALVRPNEIAASGGNPDKAWRMLGWRAESRLKDVVERMCESARELPL